MELLILCIKIFLVRILDVSLGTIRTIITIKGKTSLASIVGFIELLIWFIIVKEALNTESSSIFIAISYALGFAVGTYIGSMISNRIIHINLAIQIITSKGDIIAGILRDNNYGVSIMDIRGKVDDHKCLLLVHTNDRNMNNVCKLVNDIDSSAFVFINEIKYLYNGFYGIKKKD